MADAATVTCPHCQQLVNLNVTLTVAAESLTQPLRFETSKAFQAWLDASRLTVSEFRELPIYQAHPEQFDPLIDGLYGDAASAGSEQPTLQAALRPHPARDDVAEANRLRLG